MNSKITKEDIEYLEHSIDRIEENVRNIRKVLTIVCKAIDKEELKTILTTF